MMKLTKKQLAESKKKQKVIEKLERENEALARFCGGKRWWSHESSGQQSEPGWLFEQLRHGWPVIMCADWNPRHNGSHMMLVLEAWAKKDGWFYILRLLSSQAFDNKDFNFGDAVCEARLEVLGKDGGR